MLFIIIAMCGCSNKAADNVDTTEQTATTEQATTSTTTEAVTESITTTTTITTTRTTTQTTTKEQTTTLSREEKFLKNKNVSAGNVKYQNDVEMQKYIFDAMNDRRKAAGIKPLKYYKNADGIALIRTNELVSCMSHIRPDGTECNTLFNDNNWSYSRASENIAGRFTDLTKLPDAWMSSPSHKEAAMNTRFKYTTVSVIKADDGKYYSVQLFFEP